MQNQEISLDALLEEQQRTRTLVTVEAVPGKPELVKITPWFPKRGCACSFALVVSKKSIHKLTKTEHHHPCCGKLLTVVEVEFTEGSVLPLSDVFADLARRAALTVPKLKPRASASGGRRGGPQPRSFRSAILPIVIGDGWPTSGGGSGGEGDDGDGQGDEDGDDDENGDGDSTNFTSFSACMASYMKSCFAQNPRATFGKCWNLCFPFCEELTSTSPSLLNS